MNSGYLVVVKFGGSSLSDAEQFKKVANIIHAQPSRRYVIPSAPGKRFSGDTKVTDMLYNCYDKAIGGVDIESDFNKIVERYSEIIGGLSLSDDFFKRFIGECEKIKEAFFHQSGRDFAASRGEYLNGLVLAEYLGFDFIDAARVIFFNEDGSFDSEKTNDVLARALKAHERAVIPGFYGVMPNNTIKTFSRGGSDITGSIVARAAIADIYENWTDVSGFLMADPRIVDNPKVIDTITYHELRELSYMGATVLHEDSIFPLRYAGIPIHVCNTNDPSAKGTMIVAESGTDSSPNVITGIAGKKGFSVVTIEKDMMNAELGFGRRVLEVFEKLKISFEHLPSGIDTLSIVISSSDLDKNKESIVNMICAAVEPDSVCIESGMALMAVVGRGMINEKGTAARVCGSLAKNNVNIRMIDQGSSEMNIIIGINESDFESALRAIYKEFVPN